MTFHWTESETDPPVQARTVSPWFKYLVFQIPGWVITAMVLIGLTHWQFLPKWLAVACFLGWLLKDLLLYPFFRPAYEPGVTGSARLVGARGVAEGDLAPMGYIRVRGELWRAVATPTDHVIRSGTEVEIVNAERMEVLVRAVGSRSGE
jgi:membrane protein implicated in regulation of membrane protease activity